MKIKAGDTYPNPTADLNADVTGATVEFRMMHLDGTFLLEGPATDRHPTHRDRPLRMAEQETPIYPEPIGASSW